MTPACSRHESLKRTYPSKSRLAREKPHRPEAPNSTLRFYFSLGVRGGEMAWEWRILLETQGLGSRDSPNIIEKTVLS